MGRRRVPAGWAAWFLVLAAALPDAVLIRLGGKVLTGAADAPFGLQDRSLDGLELLGNRWSSLWMIQSYVLLPLTGLLPLVVLAALVVAGRPRALVPRGLGRGAAALVAGVTALLGLTGTVAVVAQFLGLLPGLPWGSMTGSQVEAYAPVAALVVTTAVLGAAATAVLWPRGGGEDDAGAVVEVPTEDGAVEGRTVDEGPAEQVVADAVADRPAAPPPVAAADLPTPSVEDLDLYRRR